MTIDVRSSEAANYGELLTQGSMSIYAELHICGHDIEFTQRPMLWLATQPEHVEHANALGFTKQSKAAPGNPVWLDADEVCKIEPMLRGGSVQGAVMFPNCAVANPRKTTLALAKEACKQGVEIGTQQEVFALEEDQGLWCVHVRKLHDRLADEGEEHRIWCGTVVIAAGAWSRHLGELAGASIPVIPVVGQMWSTSQQPKGTVKHIISSMESDVAWDNYRTTPPRVTHEAMSSGGTWAGWQPRLTRHLYGKQTADGCLIFGGDRRVHPKHQPGMVHPLPREVNSAVDENRTHVVQVMPNVQTLPVTRTWGGIMAFTPDGNPIIGAVKHSCGSEPRLFAVTGLGGCGFMQGAMAGRLLAEFIASGATHIPKGLANLDPSRFEQELDDSL